QIVPLPQEFPPGMNFGAVTFPPGKDAAVLNLTVAANVPPGTYNFVLRGFAPIAPKVPKAKAVNVVMPSTALKLVVLPKTVATLSVANPNLTLKAGQQAEVVVRVNRQHDYDGDFKIELILPPNVKGVTASPVVIPPGANE